MIHYIICEMLGSAKDSERSLRSTRRDVLGFASLLVFIDSVKFAAAKPRHPLGSIARGNGD